MEPHLPGYVYDGGAWRCATAEEVQLQAPAVLSIGCRVENKFAGYGSNKWHGVVEDGPDDKGKWAVRWAEDAAERVRVSAKMHPRGSADLLVTPLSSFASTRRAPRL